MTTALLTNAAGLAHVTPDGHPERVARLQAVLAALDTPTFNDLLRVEAPLADNAEALRAHPQGWLDRLGAALPETGEAPLDGDTWLSPGSLRAALGAVGAAGRAVDMVLSGEAQNTFCATRPPGHHAERARGMGFCLLGTNAIAAKRALDYHGLGRVAVVDFDVHHGNGTQDILWDEGRALYVSLHQMPLYPGTGATEERGAHDNILNIPLPPGSDGAAMRRAFADAALPRLDAFAPELILVSAGFDAHARDPLANLMWVEDDFAWITHTLCDLADTLSGGRLVSTLEGGYDLDALAASVAAHVQVLMERGR